MTLSLVVRYCINAITTSSFNVPQKTHANIGNIFIQENKTNCISHNRLFKYNYLCSF